MAVGVSTKFGLWIRIPGFSVVMPEHVSGFVNEEDAGAEKEVDRRLR